MQAEQEINGGLGFGGHMPCGQTQGTRKVFAYGERPIDKFNSLDFVPLPAFYGAVYDDGLLAYSGWSGLLIVIHLTV